MINLPARSAPYLLLALGFLPGCTSAPPALSPVTAPATAQPVPDAPVLPEEGVSLRAARVLEEGKQWKAKADVESRRKALECFEEALALWREAGDRLNEATTLNLIGATQLLLGESDSALANSEAALALAVEIGDLPQEAEARNNLALLYDDYFANPKAQEFYEASIALWERLGDHKSEGATLYNLAMYLFKKGDREGALDCLNRSLESRRKVSDRGGEARTLAALAAVRSNDDPAASLDQLRRALQISQEVSDRQSQAWILRVMGSTYLTKGDLQEALESFTQALDIFQELGERAYEAMVLSSLGATSLHLGDTAKALEYYTRALEIHRLVKNRTWEAYALRDIGWVQNLRGNLEVALDHYQRALEISRDTNDRLGQAASLHGLGRTRTLLKQAEEAVANLEEAVSLYESLSQPFRQISALLELGRAWQALSRLDRAEDCFRRALALSQERPTLIAEAVAHWAIARLERDRGNYPEAASAVEEALKLIESVRPNIASQKFRVSFFASRRDYYDLYVDLQMRLHELRPDQGHVEKALAASERARARNLLDLLSEGRIDLQSGISPGLKREETEIADRISSLQTQLLDDLSAGGRKASEIEKLLRQAEEDRERFSWKLRRDHPHYAAVRDPSPLSLPEIQALLDEHTALLEFAVGQERSFLFVVLRDRLIGFPLPSSSELSILVEKVRQGLQEPGRRSFASFLDASYRLYQILIQPAEPLLRDKTRLIVAPDGPLLLLSFEALVTSPVVSASSQPGALPYLILDRSVSYIPSASVLAELNETRPVVPEPEDKLFLGFGSPDYGDPQLQLAEMSFPGGSVSRTFQEGGLLNLPPLPDSAREVTEIAKLYPEERVGLYLHGLASEENVKNNPFLRRARRIHFAVHGLLSEEEPELSGLVLKLGGETQENGLLQVYEIFNMELTADLVVLSACETALGKNIGGEGLVGVTRALLYAGAASVVVSLWRVADIATSDLMIRFYRHLNQTADRSEALRSAKLEAIREGAYGHPNYWAPFILVGQPK